jgi:hypothetical protein
MSALDNTLAIAIMKALTPCGTSGAPGTTLAALGSSGMQVNITSTASTATSAGTPITGTGSGAITLTNSSSVPSGNPPTLTLPATAAISWTNGSGSAWSIVSCEITDCTTKRVWFGNWNGQPVSVANGNVFQVAVAGITLGLS